MRAVLNIYQKVLAKHPVSVQAFQTGLLMGTGDLISQVFVEKKSMSDISYQRTEQFFIVGAVCVGPPLRLWYGLLEKFFGSQGKAAVLKKVATDQLLFAPIFMGTIMGIIKLVQGSTVEEAKEKLQADYSDVLINNYKLWPGVQLINFYFVPLQYQVLTVQFVAIIWNTYLSWKMNQDIEKVQTK